MTAVGTEAKRKRTKTTAYEYTERPTKITAA